jgi:hypothetical protein
MRRINTFKVAQTKEEKAGKIAAFFIMWGIIIPLIAAAVIASWNLLLGLIF